MNEQLAPGTEILVWTSGEWADNGATVQWHQGEWVYVRDYFGIIKVLARHVKRKNPQEVNGAL